MPCGLLKPDSSLWQEKDFGIGTHGTKVSGPSGDLTQIAGGAGVHRVAWPSQSSTCAPRPIRLHAALIAPRNAVAGIESSDATLLETSGRFPTHVGSMRRSVSFHHWRGLTVTEGSLRGAIDEYSCPPGALESGGAVEGMLSGAVSTSEFPASAATPVVAS